MNQFIITHETVVLNTDFHNCELTGFVELTVSLQKEYFYIKQSYHDSNFNRISVNLPVLETESFTIHEVTVDGYNAKYEKREPYLRRINKNFSDIADLHNFETLFLSNIADVMDYGELMITIPSQLLETNISSLMINEPLHKKQKLSFKNTLLEPLIVKIAFTAKDPIDGIHWIVPRDNTGTPSTSPSLSTSNTNTNSRESSPNKMATTKRKRRFGEMEYNDSLDEQKKNEVMYADRACHMYSYNVNWMPCLNGLKHRCTYTLQLSVPSNYIAICNGDLRVSKSNVFVYDISEAILARHLMFAVGPFREIVLNDVLPQVATALSPSLYMNNIDIDDDDDSETDEKKDIDNDCEIKNESVLIKVYVLDVYDVNDVIITCFNIDRILAVYSAYLELPFPFCTLSFVFVDEAYRLGCSYLNVNILSSDLIHDELSIEAAYSSNDIISRCIADNWMNYAFCISFVCDLWIAIGFAGLLHSEWLSIFEGQNEMEYRKAIWRLHREENGPHPHWSASPPLSWNGYLHESQFYMTYYPFIKEKSQFVMIMLRELIGSQSFKRNVNIGNRLIWCTDSLESHLCGIFSEKQIKSFFRHFVYGDCCPKICAEYEYKAKDKRHLLCIKQERSSSSYCNVIGTLKIEIQELSHCMVEYIEIPDVNSTTQHEFVCQSRAKRKHKNGDNEAWLEAPANNDTPIKFVRIDPDYEMLFHLVFFIIDSKIAITQLLHDDVRNVKSQIEAIYSLRFVPSKDVSDALLQTLNDEMNYYKVRLEAAKALAQDRNPATLDENKTELINIIHKLWTKIKSKHYTIIHYFLIKSIIGYLSNLSQHKYPHYTPIEVVELILTILKELIDDNLSEFRFNIDALTAQIIINLGNIRVSTVQYGHKLDEIVNILSQILSLQRLFKSCKGMVRSSCLKTFAKLYLNHPEHSNLYLPIKKIQKFTKYGKFHDNVRLNAFKIMVNLIKDCNKNIKKCLQIINNECVPRIKLEMMRIWQKTNIKRDYLNEYELMADKLHNQEKLIAINLRPTLRGFTTNKNTFIDDILRNKNELNQSFIASTIWSMLLKSCNQKHEYQIHSNIVKSLDILFVIYDLYKSIWGFKAPPFFHQKMDAILFADDIGNQKRVHDCIQKLKSDFNNNNPKFCSFGVQSWRCT